MNLKQINEFRVAHNLQPLPVPAVSAKKKGNGNAAKRAQENRDMKAKRGTRSK